MRRKHAKALLDEGKAAIGSFVMLDGLMAPEIMGRAGYDFVLLDGQHGLATPTALLGAIQAVDASGASAWVRVPWCEPAAAMRALDSGAEAVICPMVETPEEVARFVGACRYPPAGYRSWGPFRAFLADQAPRAGYEGAANAATLAIAMIETAKGLDAVEAIAAVPHLSALYIGPNDLGAALGVGAQPIPEHPKMLAALERVLAAASAAGIVAGIHCATPEMARDMLGQGFRFVTLSADAGFLEVGARAGLAAIKEG